MRKVLIIIVSFLIFWSCVKRPSNSPIPTIEYSQFVAWKIGIKDTAFAELKYEDGDGDIFLAETTDGPNIIGTFYYLNSATQKYTAVKDPITNDTLRFTQTVLQPKDANYKGKSIRGEIIIPFNSFRLGDSIKNFKYTFFVLDGEKHKSNIVTTPVIHVDF